MSAMSSEADQPSEGLFNRITSLSVGADNTNTPLESDVSMDIEDDEDLASTQGGNTPREPPSPQKAEGHNLDGESFASLTTVSDTRPPEDVTLPELSTPSPPPKMSRAPSFDVDIPGLNVLHDIDIQEDGSEIISVPQDLPVCLPSPPVVAPQLSEAEASSRLRETLLSAVLTNSKLRQPDLDLDSLSMKLSDTITQDDGQRLLTLLRSSISAESLHRVQMEYKKPQEASQPQTALEQEAVDLINDVIAEETRRHYTQIETQSDRLGRPISQTPEQIRARLASSDTVQNLTESTGILRILEESPNLRVDKPTTYDPFSPTWSNVRRPEVSQTMDISRSVSPAFSMHSSDASSSQYKTSPKRRRMHEDMRWSPSKYGSSPEQRFSSSATGGPSRHRSPPAYGQHPDYHFDRERNYGHMLDRERVRWPPADTPYGNSSTKRRRERGQWREGYGYDYPDDGFVMPPPASAPAFFPGNASGSSESSRLGELKTTSPRSWQGRGRSHSPPTRRPDFDANDVYGHERMEQHPAQKSPSHLPIKSGFDSVTKSEHEMKIDRVPTEALPVPGQWARYEAGPGSSVWEHKFVIASAQAQEWNVWAEGQGRRSDVTRQVQVQIGCSTSHGAISNGNVPPSKGVSSTAGHSMGQWPPKGTILIEVNPGTPVGRLVIPDDKLCSPVDITHTLKEGDNIVRLAQLDSVGDMCAYVVTASWLEIPHTSPSFFSLNNAALSVPTVS